jgi:hypothetical protein
MAAPRCAPPPAAAALRPIGELTGHYVLTMVATKGSAAGARRSGPLRLWSSAADPRYARYSDSVRAVDSLARAARRQVIRVEYEGTVLGATDVDPKALGARYSGDPTRETMPNPGVTVSEGRDGRFALVLGVPRPLTDDGVAVVLIPHRADSTGMAGTWHETASVYVPFDPPGGYFCAVPVSDSSAAT